MAIRERLTSATATATGPRVPPEAQRTWELEYPGTWERFTEVIRHAWDKARARS